MTDEQAQMLLDLLNLYVVTYGGPEQDGMINPHKMTLVELRQDLETSTGS
jgi:hypothetical protein